MLPVGNPPSKEVRNLSQTLPRVLHEMGALALLLIAILVLVLAQPHAMASPFPVLGPTLTKPPRTPTNTKGKTPSSASSMRPQRNGQGQPGPSTSTSYLVLTGNSGACEPMSLMSSTKTTGGPPRGGLRDPTNP